MNIHRPNLPRLIEALRVEYNAAPRGEKMTTLHLFGIVHAEQLAVLDSAELEAVALAAGSLSFATELRKMVKLARFVVPKSGINADAPLSGAFLRVARPLPAGYRFDREDANAR